MGSCGNRGAPPPTHGPDGECLCRDQRSEWIKRYPDEQLLLAEQPDPAWPRHAEYYARVQACLTVGCGKRWIEVSWQETARVDLPG